MTGFVLLSPTGLRFEYRLWKTNTVFQLCKSRYNLNAAAIECFATDVKINRTIFSKRFELIFNNENIVKKHALLDYQSRGKK